MAEHRHFRHVHLVGSVPLADSHAVFEAVSDTLGAIIPRIPDGETGDRTLWILFQKQAMDRATNLLKIKDYEFMPGVFQATYGLADPALPVKFGHLRYAEEAKKSYQQFASLKADGRIASSTRFQVCLPTPLAVVGTFVGLQSQQAVEEAYEARLLTELTEIMDSIPHQELAIQWDVAWEMVYLEGWSAIPYFDTSKAGFVERLGRLGRAVREDVELGFHLCYGDPGHRHLIEPKDLGHCVDIANSLGAAIRRRIDWIHMPVPKDRADEAYFAALKRLRVGASTAIFLGLVHLTDGIEGARLRMSVAENFLPWFGVATECGFGRRPPSSVMDLLELHKAVAQSDA